MKKEARTIVGISVGDLNGIGCEIILKTFQDSRMMDFCTPVVFASQKDISFQKKSLDLNVTTYGIDSLDKIQHGKLNVINLWGQPTEIEFGKSTEIAGNRSFISLQKAVEALRNGYIDALVTAPINKNNIQSDDFNAHGHTEYLESQLNGKSLMLMVSGTLRVGLLTNHLPISEVASAIVPELIEDKVDILHQTLIKDFRISRPKIAVLGINPHVGDNGLIGKEDQEVLTPTIKKIYDGGKLVFGPYPADGFFGSGNHTRFDAILASYHDQGLTPFKTLSFGGGVNYTAGLSKVRTSPDHGVAYEIAGKRKADEGSFKEAVFMAMSIVKKRKEFQEITENPLKDLSRERMQKNKSRS